MSEEKPIFKCIKTKTGSRNNWVDMLNFEDTNTDIEAALAADYAKLEALGAFDDIEPLSQETIEKIIDRIKEKEASK